MQTLDTTPRDQVTVEAETVEDALAEISAEFGEDAEIMRAQKVHRGGVGGFFAKEMVQLTARRRRDAAPKLRPRPQNTGIADVLERMAQDADAEDSDFRTVLKREMGAGSAPTNATDFLAAVGWTEQDDDDAGDTAVEAETSNSNDQFVPPFAEAEALPAPVPVGPELRAVPEPEDESVIAMAEEPAAPEVTSEVPPVAEATSGSVATLHDPDMGFDEVTAVEPVEVIAPKPAVANTVEVVSPETNEPMQEEAASVPAGLETAVAASVVTHDAEDTPDWWRTAQPVDAPAGMGAVAWSTTALLRLGLPAPVLNAVAGVDDNDDLGWIDAISAAVAPHCGPLPEENVIVVGPHAERLAEPLGLPLIRSGDMAPYDGSFCAMVEDTPQDRNWLEFVRGGRGIHLVVGDEPWQDLLIDEPVAVSWVGETAVADALYLAFTLGATLGFGTVDGFVSSMVRAQPTDVALAVRRIVGRK